MPAHLRVIVYLTPETLTRRWHSVIRYDKKMSGMYGISVETKRLFVTRATMGGGERPLHIGQKGALPGEESNDSQKYDQ